MYFEKSDRLSKTKDSLRISDGKIAQSHAKESIHICNCNGNYGDSCKCKNKNIYPKADKKKN